MLRFSFAPPCKVRKVQSKQLNFIIFGLCRFIPAYKAGLSRHLPVKRIDFGETVHPGLDTHHYLDNPNILLFRLYKREGGNDIDMHGTTRGIKQNGFSLPF